MKERTNKRLARVNHVFSKYNVLAGVENLGLVDCNKYYVSFGLSARVYEAKEKNQRILADSKNPADV